MADITQPQAAALLEASRLVLRSFAYVPVHGPVWYEAARLAVAAIDARPDNARPIDGRMPITVAEWDARPDALVDSSAYWHNADALDYGGDPWRVIEGVDKHAQGDSYDVWFASGTQRTADAGQVIYIAAKHHAIMFPVLAAGVAS